MRLETTITPAATMPNGLQGTDDGLWVCDQATDDLYLLDDDLQIVRTVRSTAENSSGLTVGDGSFWIGSNGASQARYARPGDTGFSGVVRCDYETGEEIARFPTPDGGGIHGVEWVEGLIWITAFNPKALVLMDPTDWSVVTKVEVPHERLHGLAWVGDGIWCAHTSDKFIIKYNPETGEEVDRITYGDDDPAPHGFTTWKGRLWSCDANWPSPVHPDGPSISRIVR